MEYVLAHLPELVVKEVHGAGGYGMLIGPAASKAEIEQFRRQIIATPERYIAQPTLALSTCPTFATIGLAPRHIDLRPFVLSGRDVTIVPGGLTRVALREGSLGGQLLAGRRHQGHLGAGRADAQPHRRSSVLDVALHRARGEPRAPGRCALPHVAAASVRRHADAIVERDHERLCRWSDAYRERHETIEPRAVFEFVSLDRDYGGSIVSCLRVGTRERARRARLAHLRALGNAEFHLARRPLLHGAQRAERADIGQFVEWVKERSHLTRGVTIGTMLRDEAFHFTRIGTFLERADSTARILTAHQSDLAPGADASRGAGSLRVERAAAGAVGVRGLPARLPRRDHAATRWRRC